MKLPPLFTCIFTSVLSTAAIVISGISFFAVSHNIETSRRNLQDIVNRIMLTSNEYTTALNLSELLRQRESDINRLNNLSINKKRPLDFIEHIESIARLTGSSLALGVEEIKSDPSILLFRVTIDSNETGSRNFIKLIEMLPYEISIDTLSFQRDSMNISGGVNIRPTVHVLLTMKVKAQ